MFSTYQYILSLVSYPYFLTFVRVYSPMKRIVLLLTALVSLYNAEAQTGKYWIVFTDKNGSPYSVSTPGQYLSARAIARRAKYSIPVQYNDLPPNPSYIDSVISKGVVLLNRSRWFNAISIYAADTTKLALIRSLPFVKSSKFVTRVKPKKKVTPLKPFGENKSTKRPEKIDSINYGNSYNQVHMIKVDCLNNMGFRGKGMRIAVIDTRFGKVDTLPAFDSLRYRGQILGTWDFVWGIKTVFDTNGSDSHGQDVLSCMGGNLPGQLMGDAMDADYYLLRTEDAYSENMIEVDNWVSGAEYADSAGANIITSSLGYSTFDDPNNSFTYADMNGKVSVASRAATIASEKGLVVCVAAGNEGGTAWQYITSPGDADSILTVGAVDPSGVYAVFSSTGPSSDKRVKPDVVAQGGSCALASSSGGVFFGSGTSFATPITAGAVASLWQTDTNASNYQIMDAIKKSASQYSHPDSLLGYGLPDYCLARSILTGIQENRVLSQLVKSYPDPFTNQVTLMYYSSAKQKLNVAMYNEVGQNVYQSNQPLMAGGNTVITLNGLDNLSSGIYFIVMTDEQGVISTSKVMKR